MTKNKTYLDELIIEGNQFSFDNNKKFSYREFFSEATSDFLAWVSKVEDYILMNFDENSGPYKMLNSVDKSKFNGYYQSEFDSELTKLKGAISSCKYIKQNKKKHDNQILNLIKNPLFWTVLVVVIGATYKLGYDNGIAKFDNEKIEMKNINKSYKDSMNILNNKLRLLQDTIIKRHE